MTHNQDEGMPDIRPFIERCGSGTAWRRADIEREMREYGRACMPAWQDIATAPKGGGGLVDIMCGERRYAGCHYDRICDEYRHITSCGVLIRLKGATHWMPIPNAPTPPKGSDHE